MSTDEPRRVRPFADFMLEHSRGAGHTKASESLQRLVNAVKDTGKKGSITVTVIVDPMKQSEDALLTTILVAEKLPAIPPKAAVFYADEDGNLTKTDPGQLDFDSLREVEQPPLRDDGVVARGAAVIGEQNMPAVEA
jgi:hypothetical protein